jgi:hypothetical protein
VVWHYTLKQFADLALAQAHEARTLQLRAISRGAGTPYLSVPSKIHPPRHTRRGGRFQLLRTLYDYLIEFNLERYTINRPKIDRKSILEDIRKKYQKWIPESKPKDK